MWLGKKRIPAPYLYYTTGGWGISNFGFGILGRVWDWIDSKIYFVKRMYQVGGVHDSCVPAFRKISPPREKQSGGDGGGDGTETPRLYLIGGEKRGKKFF